MKGYALFTYSLLRKALKELSLTTVKEKKQERRIQHIIADIISSRKHGEGEVRPTRTGEVEIVRTSFRESRL